MIRRSIIALVFLGAVFGTLDSARAGKITYDWVTPSFTFGDKGTHFTGSITVDSAGLSATPIDLTASRIQSWQISVLDSTDTLIFSLASSSNGLDMTDTDSPPPHQTSAPQITSTSIYLPALPPLVAPHVDERSTFALLNGPDRFTLPLVPNLVWQSRVSGQLPDNTFFSTSVTVNFADGSQAAGGFLSTNGKQLIATNETPEPGGLAIASLGVVSVTGWVGAGRVRRRQSIAAAV